MPCQTFFSDRDIAEQDAERIRELEKLWIHDSPVAAMLCAVLGQIAFDQSGKVAASIRLTDLPADVQEWWKEHKKRDALRHRKEALAKLAKETVKRRNKEREAALAKLTPKERKLLGHK